MAAASTSTPTMAQPIHAELVPAAKPIGSVRRTLRRARRWLCGHPRIERGYRIGVGVVGTVLALVGLVLVPLPGPGWLVVFAGLALLGTEFVWAHRLSHWLKSQLARFWAWWRARRAQRRAAAS